MGRFVGMDALAGMGQHPYSYASNDPFDKVDPTGLFGEEFSFALSMMGTINAILVPSLQAVESAVENTGFQPLSNSDLKIYRDSLARLSQRGFPDQVTKLRAVPSVVKEGAAWFTGCGTDAFACVQKILDRKLVLTPVFLEYAREDIDTGAFVLLHESFHLDEGLFANEPRAYGLAWPHKEKFGFYQRYSGFWNDMTRLTLDETCSNNPTGFPALAGNCPVTYKEYVWGTTGQLLP